MQMSCIFQLKIGLSFKHNLGLLPDIFQLTNIATCLQEIQILLKINEPGTWMFWGDQKISDKSN